MRKLLLALAFIVAAALPARAGTFYIDSSATGCGGSACSNSNAGTSPSAAWADSSKISSLSLNAGDLYLFRRGNTYRYPTVDGSDMIVVGTVSTSVQGNPIIFGAYGTGTKPIINGSVCEGSGNATVTPPFGGAVAQASPCSGATPVTWTLDSGSIYKISFAAAYPFNVIVDGPTGDSVFPVNTTSGSGYGLSWAGCKTGSCPQSTTSVPAAWATGQTYSTSTCISNAVQGTGEWFCATVHTAVSGGSAPVCSAGGTCQNGTTTNVTQNDTGNTWAFEGVSAFAQGAMTAGTAYWDGQSLFVWMPDGSNPGNHSIEVVTHVHGFRANSNNSEKNNITVQGLHFHNLGEGLRFFSNGSGAANGNNCQGGHTVANNIIDGIGTPNADDGQFLTAVRYSQANSTNCISGLAQTKPTIIGNRIDHMGGRGITCQACAGGIEAENEASFCPHSCINDVSVAGTADNGLIQYHNYVHDIHHSLTYASSFPDTAVAIYDESSNNLIISDNTIYNVTDPNCSTAQCDGIQTFNNSGTQILNNTIYGAQNGIYITSSGANHIVENNLIAALTGGSNGTSQLAMNFNNTCCTTIDYNVLSSAATVGSYNSVSKTFAQWQTLGFDIHGFNSDATFSPNAMYPFALSPSSVGYRAADTSIGFGWNIGGNQSGGLPVQGQ